MRRILMLGLLGWLASNPAAGGSVVRVVEFDTNVNPVTIQRITRAIDDAEREKDDLVLIQLNTPGGLVISMEKLVERMLNSEVPVVAWVGPSGAHAASAGFFILMAADVASMAPGTRTGAAATVFGTGEGGEDNVLLKKSNEDLAALIRSIARKRGRDPEASEKAVFEAKAYEETVALDLGLIELIAKDREELLRLLDGRTITKFDGTEVVLETSDPREVTSELDYRQKFMEFLGHPEVAYLLFMFGLLGLYIEFTNPGAIFPAVAGALCLLLFAVAAQALPVSYIGLLLILLAIVMFILEIKVTSFGMLTVGGVVSLIIGSILLIDGPIPELRVPPSLVIPTSVVIAVLCVIAVRLALRAQRAKVETGIEGLSGAVGTVTRTLDPDGKVFVRGELWDAGSEQGPIPEGARVRVLKVEELRLTVEPVERPQGG